MCRECINEERRNLRHASRGSLSERRLASQKVRYRRLGTTVEEVEKLHRAQDGLCAICKRPETATNKDGEIKMLAVDHDHETGRIRELLCNRCNAILGMAQDSIGRLVRAALYLAKHGKEDEPC